MNRIQWRGLRRTLAALSAAFVAALLTLAVPHVQGASLDDLISGNSLDGAATGFQSNVWFKAI